METNSSASSAPKAAQQHEDGSPVAATTSVTLDLAAFSCPSCSKPLLFHIYQCDQGHVVCSVCALGGKCCICARPTGSIRCLGLEKVIESMRTSCKYAEQGCLEKLLFKSKLTHEDICLYGPCSCPYSDCVFEGSALELSSHIDVQHPGAAFCFQYSVPFEMSLRKQELFRCLKGEDGLLFVLEHSHYDYNGYVVVVTCFKSAEVKGEFFYDIAARGEGASAVLHIDNAAIKNIKYFGYLNEDIEYDGDAEFLVIPPKLLQGENQCVKLTICIKEVKITD